jgi:hypothetical protein
MRCRFQFVSHTETFRSTTTALRRSSYVAGIRPTKKQCHKDILQDSTKSSTTVIEHVLSRLKDIGISKVFGVAGDFAFPLRMQLLVFLVSTGSDAAMS